MQSALYTIVSEQTIRSIADTFYAFVHLPIRINNESGEVLVSIGETPSFCRLFQKHLPSASACEKQHASAGKRAVSLGEAYIFVCHAELNNIAFPLISNHTFMGSILVGPFLMDEPDSILISDVAKRYRFSTDDALDLYDETRTLPVISPGHVTDICHLLVYLFSNLIADSRDELRQNNQKLLQQSKISESIQRYKSGSIRTDSYPYEKEKELFLYVKRGDVSKAKAILNDLLGYVLFSEGSSLDVVKPRAIELCSLLSRTAIEGGAPTDSILKLNNHFLQNLQQIDTITVLCYKLQEIVETFTESMFNHMPSRNSELIKNAMLYMSERFNTSLTLEQVADHVHLHPSYFSTLFKSSTGSSFKEYLNMVRIEESKRLLSNTNYSIIDIAIAVGFEDQSYFSKVFKKYTGLTPKQFR